MHVAAGARGMNSVGFYPGPNSLELPLDWHLSALCSDVGSPMLACARKGQKGLGWHFLVQELPVVCSGSGLSQVHPNSGSCHSSTGHHLPSTNCEVYLASSKSLTLSYFVGRVAMAS